MIIDCNEEPKSIEIIAYTDTCSESILNYDQRKINKYRDKREINTYIDEFTFNEETKTYQLKGWAYSYAKDPIEYSVLDSNGKKVDIEFHSKGRVDLYSLFFVGEDQIDC